MCGSLQSLGRTTYIWRYLFVVYSRTAVKLIYTYDLKYLTVKILQKMPITRFQSEGYSAKWKIKWWQGNTCVSLYQILIVSGPWFYKL